MESKLQMGQRVELLPGREDVYPRALPASRGIIRGFDTDEYGFERVYIDWDKDHWRYNGEPDMWTFAAHFRAAGVEDDRELIGAEVHDVPTTPSGLTEQNEKDVEDYLDTLMAACDRAAESEGFYFVSLKRDEQNQIRLEILSAAIDEELRSISGADVFRFVEQEMRRREL